MSEYLELLNLHHAIEYQPIIKDFICSCIESCILSPKSKSNYASVKELFHKFRWQSIYQSVCLECIGNIILHHLNTLTENATFEDRLLDKLKMWLTTVIIPFVEDFLQYSKVIQAKVCRAALELFVNLQFRKLFEMITDFPDSLVALKELHHCINIEIETYDTMGIAGPMLRNILSRRLLHLGATTSQILDFYISMIKSLRVIDPTDALLNFVAIPVRTYLQNRSDTIRCIISSLTETKDSDLHGELRHGGSLAYGLDEDDEDIGHGDHWIPNKRNQQIMELSDKSLTTPSRGLDILATLVSIYGSTELFINEYTQLLAEKMLHHATLVGQKYSTEQEVANIELLKIR
jgi:anaphase-promoting complex subunit 2